MMFDFYANCLDLQIVEVPNRGIEPFFSLLGDGNLEALNFVFNKVI
uniref:Uncharacterized protein n=1 Tax=Rhizophora mucronata TaxID=61149 RepID=A0A2P2Q4U2_RHIMU